MTSTLQLNCKGKQKSIPSRGPTEIQGFLALQQKYELLHVHHFNYIIK